MGDVTPVQSRDGVAEKKLSSDIEVVSTINKTRSGGLSQTLQEPAKSTCPANPTIRLSGAEYNIGSPQCAPRPSRDKMSIPLNMADMNPALPPYQATGVPFGQQYVQAHQSPGIMYPVQHMPYMGQTPGQPMYNVPYSPGYQNPYMQQQPQGYATYHPPNQAANRGIYNPSYYSQHPYNTRFETNPTTSKDYHPSQLTQTPPKREIERRVSAANYDVSQTIVDGSSPMKPSRRGSLNSLDEQTALRLPFTATSSAPRGPPRKPKQSGHALWVGNLPPATSVIDLKDHFSLDATGDIESVFLIAKSNCAFVNYKGEDACVAAVTRFHDSRFHGVRLVCRLRKGVTVPGSSQPPPAQPAVNNNTFTARDEPSVLHSAEDRDGPASFARKRPRVPERFFIVKSLTVEDLEGSRQSGVWATQTHNEVTLNEAYDSADNVYLIFSANKSGEYFGYARMASPIVDDGDLAREAPSRVGNVLAETDDLEVTSTEATATAPKGRIIDDSVRGTIFWEADSSEDNDDEEEKSVDEDNNSDDDDDDEDPGEDGNVSQSEKGVVETPDETGATGAQSLGKPFRIHWMSTDRVPFYRTRGLRNPWNANREVKIARDGTEIEPSVGRRLTQLFHSHLLGPTTPSNGLTGICFQRPY